ncbi:MAG: SpoVR family protein [Desulfoprunum sp.]|jgi:stage V sporulation protein R|uniref:SpoVR family protein n=1 Tax=Desulfoprunum sp. TaxID=2020866 RepID=UPI00052BB20D|nr:SpoVR family protein [Desulfobulbus sp. Tol-SR]
MELISQHAKKIMEGCKERARDAGLSFQDESLEYIVTNRDLLQLSPKMMIPTLYDYWVQDVEVLKEQGRYELYPNNPYETVINTRPPISYYNDNNPDWLNVMIFYHVIGHIDFFQNNIFFRHTREYDFTGRALSDKRLFAKLRSEKGRWVDYIIEFSRAVDNLVGYFDVLAGLEKTASSGVEAMIDYYFDVFLQKNKKAITRYVREIELYNKMVHDDPVEAERRFLDSVKSRHPEFESLYDKSRKEKKPREGIDVLRFLMEYSPFLNREDNRWMLTVLEVIRSTSLYFQPQIRTKIMNEGWASYWHEKLFLGDDRIGGHEVEYALVNAKVTSMPRVGLNPYALGMRLFDYLEEKAEKGKISFDYNRIEDKYRRRHYDRKTGRGKEFIFSIRENSADSMFINSFIDQEFVDRHRLFVAGKRLNKERMTWQYYVKSRRAEDYRQMVSDSLYHPPLVKVSVDADGTLILNHVFEGKPLVREYIDATLMGLEFLWGGKVCLYTSEPVPVKTEAEQEGAARTERPKQEISWKRFRYTMSGRKLVREPIEVHGQRE